MLDLNSEITNYINEGKYKEVMNLLKFDAQDVNYQIAIREFAKQGNKEYVEKLLELKSTFQMKIDALYAYAQAGHHENMYQLLAKDATYWKVDAALGGYIEAGNNCGAIALILNTSLDLESLSKDIYFQNEIVSNLLADHNKTALLELKDKLKNECTQDYKASVTTFHLDQENPEKDPSDKHILSDVESTTFVLKVASPNGKVYDFSQNLNDLIGETKPAQRKQSLLSISSDTAIGKHPDNKGFDAKEAIHQAMVTHERSEKDTAKAI